MDDTGDHHQERGVRSRRRHPTLIPKTDQHAPAAEGIRPVRAADQKLVHFSRLFYTLDEFGLESGVETAGSRVSLRPVLLGTVELYRTFSALQCSSPATKNFSISAANRTAYPLTNIFVLHYFHTAATRTLEAGG